MESLRAGLSCSRSPFRNQWMVLTTMMLPPAVSDGAPQPLQKIHFCVEKMNKNVEEKNIKNIEAIFFYSCSATTPQRCRWAADRPACVDGGGRGATAACWNLPLGSPGRESTRRRRLGSNTAVSHQKGQTADCFFRKQPRLVVERLRVACASVRSSLLGAAARSVRT